MNGKPTISSFRGRYYFLSNFFNQNVTYDGITYKNNEAAFQAQKCIDKKDRYKFANLQPNEAKSLGRRVKLRPDWEAVKDQIMRDICFAKFMQSEDLKKELILTGNADLVEGNTWGDDYWGVCTVNGKNKLGKILMKIREELE